MIVVLVVLATNNECKKDVVGKVSFWFCSSWNNFVAGGNGELIFTFWTNEVQIQNSCLWFTYLRILAFLDYSLPLLFDTDFCNFLEVQITSGDWFMLRCFLGSCSGSWPLSWKKPSTLRVVYLSSSLSFVSSEDLVLFRKATMNCAKSLEDFLQKPFHFHFPFLSLSCHCWCVF